MDEPHISHGPSPHIRFSASFAFDPSDNALPLFGGLGGTPDSSPVLGDTWWFSGSPGVLDEPNRDPAFNESGLLAHTRWTVTLSPAQGRTSPSIRRPDRSSSTSRAGSMVTQIATISGYHITTGSYHGFGDGDREPTRPPLPCIGPRSSMSVDFSASRPARLQPLVHQHHRGRLAPARAPRSRRTCPTGPSLTSRHLGTTSMPRPIRRTCRQRAEPVRSLEVWVRVSRDLLGIGPPRGGAWFVNLTGGGPPLNGTGTSLSTFLPNGTYTFTVATGDKHLAPT